jgi:hypothetical protein
VADFRGKAEVTGVALTFSAIIGLLATIGARFSRTVAPSRPIA